MDDDDKKISELDFSEVLDQFQIMEHIADKGPLSKGNRDLLRELEEREAVLVREKLAQPFQVAEPRADRALSDRQAWDAATKHAEFGNTAAALGREHLVEDMHLSGKQQEDVRRFGQSKSLEDLHKGENATHARGFDEERGRLAREFLEQRKLAEELEQKKSGLEKDKGHDFSH
jgi:hypothetical protein